MLTKDDLKLIKGVVDDGFAEGISKFWNDVISPFLEIKFKENDEDHEEIFRKLRQNQKEHDEMFVRLDRNDKDHKRIFVKLDQIAEKVDGHESRIKKIEKTLQTS